MDISKLIRPSIVNIKPYSSARDEFEGEASVFLDANENPYPGDYNRYPDPHQIKLKKRISEIKKVKEDQLFIGNGSDEAIDLLFRAFCEPGRDEVIIPQPTYGMYAVSASINDTRVGTVALTSDFDLDSTRLLSAITPETKIIFLCSPNNPSGNLLSKDKIIEILKGFAGIVIIDEAYIDFTAQEGFLKDLDLYPNLVVLQTLSKAWGLAGLRLGMCFAQAPLIAVLNKIKPPYNISGLTQAIALERLGDAKRKNEQVNEIIAQRRVMEANLAELRIVERVYPSDANFLLVRIRDARQVYLRLLDKGIVVRDRSQVSWCEGCLRITIGTQSENQRLLDELKRI